MGPNLICFAHSENLLPTTRNALYAFRGVPPVIYQGTVSGAELWARIYAYDIRSNALIHYLPAG